MTGKPRSAVHIPGDVFVGLSRHTAEWAAAMFAERAQAQRMFAKTLLPGQWLDVDEAEARKNEVMAAALRRLAPYLPSEGDQTDA